MSSIEFSKQQKVKLLNDGYVFLAPEEIIDRVLVQAKRPILSTMPLD